MKVGSLLLSTVGLILVGCAPAPAASPDSPAATHAVGPSSTQATGGANGLLAPPDDGRFLTALGDTLTGVSGGEAISLAAQVCDVFQHGGTGQDAASAMFDHGLAGAQSLALIRAAVTTYCPAYADAVLN